MLIFIQLIAGDFNVSPDVVGADYLVYDKVVYEFKVSTNT